MGGLTINTKISLRTVITNLDFIIASIMLLVLVVLTVYGVIMRYVVGSPLTWIEEVQLACMVWIVFCAAGGAFRTGDHVAIELFVDVLPGNVQKIISAMVTVVVVAVLGYLLYQSIGFVQLFIRSERSTSILRIPFTLIYGIAPIAFLSMILNYLYVKHIRPKREAVVG